MKDLTTALARLAKASEAREAKEAEAAKVAKARAEAREKEERQLGAILVAVAREMNAKPAELVAAFVEFAKADVTKNGSPDFEESADTEERDTSVPESSEDMGSHHVNEDSGATEGGD